MKNTMMKLMGIGAIAGAVALTGCGKQANAALDKAADKTVVVATNIAAQTVAGAKETAAATKEVAGQVVEKTGAGLEKAGAAVQETGANLQK
jgi:hypothetical protein